MVKIQFPLLDLTLLGHTENRCGYKNGVHGNVRAPGLQSAEHPGTRGNEGLPVTLLNTTYIFQAPITALAFNPDGKNLVTYSSEENKLSFWQTR